jgi:molecular chaperone DnaK (HSP70)
VNSHSLGIVANDPQTQRKRTAVLIPRNTPLPVAAKRVFKTQKQGQKSILVQIVEGESATPDDCTQLGKCVVRDLPETLPAQTPIEVRFRYAENGRLTVVVNVANSDKELQHEITRENSLTQEQLDGWRGYISDTVAAMSAAQQGSTLGLS